MTVEPKPILTIIAGANGAGKSTFTNSVIAELEVPVIDPDAEARLLRPDEPEAAAIQAGKQALSRARAYLQNDQSFAVETTLSGNTYLRMMMQAQRRGWQVEMIYIGVSNPLLSIRRVAQRVAQGGHNVPEHDIRRRYQRSLANLSLALQQVDRALVFDNSKAAGYQHLLTVENGRVIEQAFELPQWLQAILPQDIAQQAQLERQEALATAASVQIMLSHLGERQPDRSISFESQNFLFLQRQDVVTITAKQDSREILRVEGGRFIKFSPTDDERSQLQNFCEQLLIDFPEQQQDRRTGREL